MLIEIDEVAIEKKLWAEVLAGDMHAKAKVKAEINGLDLYMHALSISAETHVVVTLRELEGLNLIESVHCSAR